MQLHNEDVPLTDEQRCQYTLRLAIHLLICTAMREEHGWGHKLVTGMTGRMQASLEGRNHDCPSLGESVSPPSYG